VALRESALTTVEAVKADISSSSGLSHQTDVDESSLANSTNRLERMIEAASEQIRGFCNRNFERVTDHQEFVETEGGLHLRLMHAPVSSIDSIVWVDGPTGEVVDTLDGWHIEDADAGLVFRRTSWPFYSLAPYSVDPTAVRTRGPGRLRVTYTGGFVTPVQAAVETDPPTRTLPFLVEETCVREVVTRFWGKTRNREIETETVADTTTTYRERRNMSGAGLLPSSEAALNQFWLGCPS